MCVMVGQRYHCKCAPNSRDCSESNECDDNPCQNGGTCINSSPDYKCLCPSDYTGSNCEKLRHKPPSVIVVEPAVVEVPKPYKSYRPFKPDNNNNVRHSFQINVDTKIRVNGYLTDTDHRSISGLGSAPHSTSVIKPLCFTLAGVACCLVVGIFVYIILQRRKQKQTRRSSVYRRDGDGEEYQLRESGGTAAAATVVIEDEALMTQQQQPRRLVPVYSSPSSSSSSVVKHAIMCRDVKYVEASSSLLDANRVKLHPEACVTSNKQQQLRHQKSYEVKSSSLHCKDFADEYVDEEQEPCDDHRRLHRPIYLPDATIV